MAFYYALLITSAVCVNKRSRSFICYLHVKSKVERAIHAVTAHLQSVPALWLKISK